MTRVRGNTQRVSAAIVAGRVRGRGRGRRRRAFSLLEVILSTVILAASVMALSRVAFLARRHAIAAEDRTEAQHLCHNIVHELAAGARPLQAVAAQRSEGDQWVHSIAVQFDDERGLAAVTVTVAREENDPAGGLSSGEELSGFRLVRWIRSGRTAESVEEDADVAADVAASDRDSRMVPRQLPAAPAVAPPPPRASQVQTWQNMREAAFRLRENLTSPFPGDASLGSGSE
ncbi:MAG: hypothetical protein FJ276_03360 [Planctomycetes bacterium]|nr:hypothetical protein [Planctomycetota bacterium]